MHIANCNNSYKCGGVSLFIKCDIKYTFSCKNTVNADFLSVIIEFEGRTFFVICVYRLLGIGYWFFE